MIAHLRRVPYDGTPYGTPEPKKNRICRRLMKHQAKHRSLNSFKRRKRYPFILFITLVRRGLQKNEWRNDLIGRFQACL